MLQAKHMESRVGAESLEIPTLAQSRRDPRWRYVARGISQAPDLRVRGFHPAADDWHQAILKDCALSKRELLQLLAAGAAPQINLLATLGRLSTNHMGNTVDLVA